MATTKKSAQLSTSAVDAKVFEMLQESKSGITDKMIQAAFPNLEINDRALIINRLLSAGKLDLYKQGSELIYKLKAVGTSAVKGDNEEKIVFGIIQEAGNKGIWIRDIRFKSNLMLTQLNKILKILEGKKLIKAVKSVSATKKKVYMLYDLAPDRSITGGSWYSDQDFESEFVDVLNQQCYRFLQQKGEASKSCEGGPIAVRNATYSASKDIWKFISELGISKVQLSLEDIEMILDTLIYDGKVEKSIVVDSSQPDSSTKLYRAVQSLLPTSGLLNMPCGLCPIMKDCCEFGLISPSKCQYMNEWLL